MKISPDADRKHNFVFLRKQEVIPSGEGWGRRALLGDL